MASKTKVQLILEAKDQASKAFGSATKSINASKVAIAGMSVAVVAAATATANAYRRMVSDMAAAGDAMDKMSARTGVSVDSLSKLGHAANLGGASIETVEKALKKLATSMYDAQRGSKEYVDSFGDLNLEFEDGAGRLKDVDEVLVSMADALNGVEDETRKAALAQKLLGRSGTELLPMLRKGSGALRDQMNELDRLGGAMSGEFASDSAEFVDAQTRMETAWESVKRSMVGVALNPSTEFIGTLTDAIGSLGSYIENNQAAIETFITNMLRVANLPVGAITKVLDKVNEIKEQNREIVANERKAEAEKNLQEAALTGAYGTRTDDVSGPGPAMGLDRRVIKGQLTDLRAMMLQEGWQTPGELPLPAGISEEDAVSRLLFGADAADVAATAASLGEDVAALTAAAAREHTAEIKDAAHAYDMMLEAQGELNRLRAEEAALDPADFLIDGPGMVDTIMTDEEFEALDRHMKKMRSNAEMIRDAVDQMKMAFGDAFADIILGAKSATEAMNGLLNMAVRTAIQIGVKALLFGSGGQVPAMAAGGRIAHAAHGYSVPSGPRGMDSVPILAMPGEEVIDRSLSSELRRFLGSAASAPMPSPDFGGGDNITIAPVLLGNLTKSQQRQAGVMLLDAYDTAKRERL